MKLPDLHDASLVSIHVDWVARHVLLRLAPVGGDEMVLTGAGLRGLTIQSQQPWGPSASILSASFAAGYGTTQETLYIAMQSGDLVLAVADSFDLSGA